MCKETINHEFSLSNRRSTSTELHGWSTKTSDLGASNWPIPNTFNVFMLDDKIQNPSECLFWFSLEGTVMDQRSGDGRYSGRFKASHSIQGYTNFPKFEISDARIASALNRIIQNSYFKKKISLEEQKGSETVSDPSWKTDRSTTSGLLVVMIPLLVTLIYSRLTCAMMMFRNSIRDGTKYCSRWARSHLMIFWKACTNEEYVSLINSKPYGNYMTLQFIRRNRSPIIKNWKRWWRQAQIRNSDYETLTPEMRESKQEHWLRIAGVNVVLKEDQENAIHGKPKDSVREETVAFSGTTRISVQNRHQNPILLLNHRKKRMVRSMPRRKTLRGLSPSGKFARQPCRDCIKGKCTRPSCNCWHPPECQFYKTESACNFGEKCSSPHWQVEDQQRKKPKKDGDKNAVAFLKDARQLVCVF